METKLFKIINTANEYMKDHLLYSHGRFTGKYTTRKIHTKLHPGPEWHIFHILTSENTDDVISRFLRLFMFGWLFVYRVKKNITR